MKRGEVLGRKEGKGFLATDELDANWAEKRICGDIQPNEG